MGNGSIEDGRRAIQALDRFQKPCRITFVEVDQTSFSNPMKTEFLFVKPKSRKAKNRFANEMDLLHSCRVENRQDGKVFLSSISGRYFFWMNEEIDDHWEVIK